MSYFFNHHQISKIIYIISDDKEFWVNLVLAFITLGAVLVALFQEKIKLLFNRAKLDVSLNLYPPDCHQIMLTNGVESIYLRIRIDHISGSSAENVEIMISGFWKFDENNQKQVLKKFLPMNLLWSHFRTHIIKIPKSMFRHCDLGFIAPSKNGSFLQLDTIVQPNPVADGEISNRINPGKYEFELLVSGDNIVPIKTTWSLEFDGVWVNDEIKMLSNHVKIKKIREIKF